MKHIIKTKTLVLFLTVMLASFLNCTTSKPNLHTDAWVDAFVKHVMTANGERYGMVFYAAGESLTSAVATAPDGGVYTLAEFWKGPGNMRYHPAGSDMKDVMPTTGECEFTLKFENGDGIVLRDTLTTISIPALTQVNVIHPAGTDSIYVNWASVSGVDVYYVKLTDKQKNESKPIFVNKNVPAADTSYAFDHNTTATPGWMRPTKPAAGDTCYVIVVGVKFEEGVAGSARTQNKQMVAPKSKMIIW